MQTGEISTAHPVCPLWIFPPFSKTEILRLLIFYDARVLFCNVNIRIFFRQLYRIFALKKKRITQNLCIFHSASFSLVEMISAFSLIIVFLSRLVLDIDAWKWHSDKVWTVRYLRNTRCLPLTLCVAACVDTRFDLLYHVTAACTTVFYTRLVFRFAKRSAQT